MILLAPFVFDGLYASTGTISSQTLSITPTAGRGKLLTIFEPFLFFHVYSQVLKQLALCECPTGQKLGKHVCTMERVVSNLDKAYTV